jgi:protein translocase SEC61 complex gamma subunit
MEAIDRVWRPAQGFINDCRRVLAKCSLPTMKVIKKTALATGTGLVVLGTAGFLFKLVSIPINNIIIGSMVH